MRQLTIKPPSQVPRRISQALNMLLAVAAVAAVATLVAEYGFRTPPVSPHLLHIAQGIIVGLFVLDRLARLALAGRRAQYLKDNWIDFALIAVVCLALAAARSYGKPGGRALSAGALWVLISQGYILVSLLLHGVSINLHFAGSGVHPSWLLLGSFAFLCLAGAGLLMLPVAVPEDAPSPYYIDALFTATSGTCVTGLIVRDTGSDWSPFGQGVILALIQIGGLGIMMFGTMLAMMLGKGLSLRGTDTMGQIMATDRVGQIGRTVGFVIMVTLGLEAIGAIAFYGMFAASGPNGASVPAGTAVWRSIFHSISSFCNAGFSLFDQNMTEGVRAGWEKPLRDHWQIMGVMAPLIVIGGLGFPVLQDCAAAIRRRLGGLARRLTGKAAVPGAAPRPRLTLHSKIVLTTSAVLIVAGAAGLLLLEPGPGPARPAVGYHPTIDMGSGQRPDWPAPTTGKRIRQAVFQSITARTAGFNTFDMAELSSAGKAWMCGLMLIGGSPASTAGGMKTMTFALLVLTVYSTIRKRGQLEAFGRSIPMEILTKAATLVVLYLTLVALTTLLLAAAMRGLPFVDLVFEAFSACGTVGLSAGVTRQLNVFGKCVIIAAMFIGRIGPVTLLAAMTSRMRPAAYEYPSENVLVG